MVGSKGSMNTGRLSTTHMSARLYADDDGRWFMMQDGERAYLALWEIEDRLRWEKRIGQRPRVRVRARVAS
jgi:hypothetical protein